MSVLSALGHDVDTVRSERLKGRNDAEIWDAVQVAHRFFVTQDLDFSDVRRYAPGTHAGLPLVRLSKPGRDMLLDRVSSLFTNEPVTDGVGVS